MGKFEQNMHNMWIKIKVLIMIILFVTPIILSEIFSNSWWFLLYIVSAPTIIYIMESTKKIKDYLSEKVEN